MADKMLIDATHPEETRVVVLRGNRVEEFDFESANRKQLRGNIYLAKVTRVEPSLQAAFVDYGGNRHGFLAFSEIHPDYYQIPVADRQALLAEEERAQQEAENEADSRFNRRGGRHRRRGANRHRDIKRSEAVAGEEAAAEDTDQPKDIAAGDDASGGVTQIEAAETEIAEITPESREAVGEQSTDVPAFEPAQVSAAPLAEDAQAPGEPATKIAPIATPIEDAQDEFAAGEHETPERPEEREEEPHLEAASADVDDEATSNGNGDANGHGEDHEHEEVESVGGADALEEVQERLPRFRRQYKIQEVIKRRQVMLVQVVKEERGTKGAALTTYLSLAGRYSVLMPNTARGGGISRKITNAEDRNRLKEIAQELEVPEGMGVILRTAGASRTKTEVKRDFEYLLRLWETVRDLTLKSTAPKLVYEEGSLVKRSIRDLYNKDIDEIVVSGEGGYAEARDFMRMLMPSHVKYVKQYKENLPLFTRYAIESQLDAMFSPVVQLRSGGYIVINQAEALVAIDVNSGRATREHHIEDTALKTNVEAAEEIARQLRLRDLAGLIVIDFIDMDESRNNRTVERRLKEALKHDRARIQVGRISHFGLLEMSRQRIRTSVLESSTEKCPVCGGSGHVRSVSSVALQLLRAVEEMLIKGATHNLAVRTRPEVALYVLNHKRAHLRELEERFRITLTISADDEVPGQQAYLIERGEQVHSIEDARNLAQAAAQAASVAWAEEDEPEETEVEAEEESEAEAEEAHAESGRRRPRRRGRGRGRGETREESEQPFTDETAAEHTLAHEDHDAGSPAENGFDHNHEAEHPAHAGGETEDYEGRRRRRRGRRGGRRNRRGHEGHEDHYTNGHSEPAEAFQQAGENAEETDAPKSQEHPREEAAPAFVHEMPPREPVFERPVNPPTAEAEYPAPTAQSSESPVEADTHTVTSEEAPRRRSTVREPAPISSEGAATAIPSSTLPPPTPVISVSSNEEPAQPRRGWWGKRLLGNKG